MRRIFREIGYDLREPGIHIFMIPPVALIFLVLAYFVQKVLDSSGQMNIITLSSLEIVIPSIGGYGAMMLMQGIMDVEGGEIAFTYHRTNLYWGLIRQFRFFMLFAILIAFVCMGVAGIMDISFSSIYYLTLAQSFAVMGVSFLGITLCRKVDIGLIVLVAFVGIQLTLGREYSTLNMIYSLDGMVPSYEQSSYIVYKCVIIGGFSWGIGQVWVKP